MLHTFIYLWGAGLPRVSPCTTSASGKCTVDTSLRCGSCETLGERDKGQDVPAERPVRTSRVPLTRVVALVSPRARALALRGRRAAGDGRVQDGEPAVTRQLVET